VEDLDFELWYRAEHPRLLASALLVGGDLEAAREAVDEALARALERWDRVRTMASPGGWAYRVTLNCLHRRHRRSTMERRLLRRELVAAQVPAPAGEIWDVVRQLSLRQRSVVVLRYVGDLTEAEIADVLGVRRSTVSTTLTNAHRALAGLLEDASGQEVMP
jgi:RNA polymerase sigma-70 factor (ECF subfamily)